MKATIESTDQIVDIDVPGGADRVVRVQARVWEGKSEAGVDFVAYIPIVQVRSKHRQDEFLRALQEHKRPTDATQRAIDMRFIL